MERFHRDLYTLEQGDFMREHRESAHNNLEIINNVLKLQNTVLEPCLQGMEAPKSGGAATGISNYTPALSQTVTIYREKITLSTSKHAKTWLWHHMNQIQTKKEKLFFLFFIIFIIFQMLRFPIVTEGFA